MARLRSQMGGGQVSSLLRISGIVVENVYNLYERGLVITDAQDIVLVLLISRLL
jgi:hypothetical protein